MNSTTQSAPAIEAKTDARREKIAVLGGGMASLTAVFALTDTPELRARYDVTVYQDGWLLGGKGASVRNRSAHGRIEEHGLHVWLGYYENAFSLMRRCYEELGRPPGAALATLRDAFFKSSAIVVEEKTARGWEHWSVDLPETDDWPGDGRPLPGFAEGLAGSVRQLVHYALASWQRALGRRPELDAAAGQLRRLLDPVIASGVALLPGSVSRRIGDGVRAALARMTAAARGDVTLGAELRRVLVILDFFGACLVGALRDGLVGASADFEALDDIEFGDWLRRHGAAESTVSSGLVRAFYHLAFCDGDGVGAGVALLGMMRMFTCYRGAIFYKMRAGMGETVFSPLYEVLRRRGVRFEFFHRVRRLELSADRRRVARVVIGRQATPISGEYAPLIDVHGLPCWPEAPLHEQLVEGEALSRHGGNLASFWSDWPDVEQRTLEAGVDFDRVVLGISIGALPFIASELVAASPRWQRMIEHVKTVRTASVQLWVTEPIDRLATSAHAPVVGAYRVPLETWADMTHLVPVERFGAGVKGIFYACGQVGHGDDPVDAADPHHQDLADLEEIAAGFLEHGLAHLWPAGAAKGGGLRWDALFDPEGRDGAERLRAQYLRVNASPSDRYVLSVPGSQKHRIAPGDSGFDNLVLAGDWTRTGYDVGCIEAATMSGLQAARALGAQVVVVGEAAPQALAPRGAGARDVAPRIELPRYIERPGEIALRSPYVLEDVWMSAFALRARTDALGALLDRCLNAPAQGQVRYVPAGPMVVLAAAFAERAFSADPEHRRFGTMPEADIAFWVPAWALRGGRAGWIPERLVWFMPHVFVTSGAAAAAGREVYGFPKSVVDVEVRRDGRALERLSVVGDTIARHAPDARGGPAQILEIARRGAAPSAPRAIAEVIGDLARPFGAPVAWSDTVARTLSASEVTLAFLKQFRDVQHTDRACYQAVVEAKATVRSLRGYGPLPGSFRVSWGDHDSHPFAAELGLDPGGQDVVAAAWVDFDFVMESGREVVRAGRAPQGTLGVTA